MTGTAEVDTVETPAPAAPPKRNGSMLLLIAGLAGGTVGGISGAYLIAPRLAGPGAAPAAVSAPASASAASADGSPKADKKGGKEPVAGRIYRVDNIIVNPAGSDGTRFLMASVAFEIQDEPSEQLLRAHDVQLRDDLIGAFEAMTLPRLTQAHARDSIKSQLGDVARRILGPQAHVSVYLPQFVIQ